MSVHHLCARSRRLEASVGSPRAGATHSCEQYMGVGMKLRASARVKMFLSLSNHLSSIILCVWVFRLYVSLCTNRHAWCPWKAEERIRSSGTGIAECCELPCRCKDYNSGPLQDQPVSQLLNQPPV